MPSIHRWPGWPQNATQTSESFGQVTGTSTMTVITTGSSSGTKGSWVQLAASTSKRTTRIIVLIGIESVSDIFQIDIGTGASGSEVVLLPNISVGYVGSTLSAIHPILYEILIPASTRIAARAAALNNASATVQVSIITIEDDA